MTQIIDLFGGGGSGMAAHTGGGEPLPASAEDVASWLRGYVTSMDEGKKPYDEELYGNMIYIAHMLNPLDLDQGTGLPEDPMPGVKYDAERNEITMPWK